MVGAASMALGGAIVAGSWVPTQTGCADKAPPPSAPPPILFGASLPLTSTDNQGTAEAVRDGIRTAEGQINAAGGLLGRPVQFVIADDQGDEADIAVARANELVQKGVLAVIGPVSSGQVLAVQQVYHDAHVIQMLPTATSTKITTIQPPNDRWLFRTIAADDFQGAAVMLLAEKTPRGLGDGGAPVGDGGAAVTCNKLAIVNLDNAYGTAMGDVIAQYWPKKTGQPILVRKSVPVDLASDYKDVIESIYTAPGGPPECMAIILYEDTGAEIVREFKADPRFSNLMKDANKPFFFIGTDGTYSDKFVTLGLANQSDPTGANVTVDPPPNVTGCTPDSQPPTPEYNQYRTIFSSYFPLGAAEAPAFSANAYDAAILVALAVAKAGTATDRVAIRDALLAVAGPPGKTYTPAQYLDALQAVQQGTDIDYKGASGNVDIQPNGNVEGSFAVWETFREPVSKKVQLRTIGRFDLPALVSQIQ